MVRSADLQLCRKQHIRLFIFIAILMVFGTLVSAAVDLTIMRIRRPKYQLGSVEIQNLSITHSTNSPAIAFSMKLETEITIKNENFWSLRISVRLHDILVQGTPVGKAVLDSSTVKIITKKTRVPLNVTSRTVSRNLNLGREIASGILTLSCNSKLEGQVGVLKVIYKSKAAIMNCTMTINLTMKLVKELNRD